MSFRSEWHGDTLIEWVGKADYDALSALLGRALVEVERLKRMLYSPEQDARQQMIRDVLRAKRDAGFPQDAIFFKEVWPVALAALKRERANAAAAPESPVP